MYRHLGNDTYSQEPIPFTYKNYSTDAKGIAKGEEETRTQVMAGVKTMKKSHKIVTSMPLKFKTNDKVKLLETDYVYKIDKVERLVSSQYAQVYGIIQNDQMRKH